MKKIYTAFFVITTLTACSPRISYLGNAYQPTEAVDVFVDESAITKAYTIVGKGYVRTITTAIPESLQRKAIAKAKQKGADAILIKDYFLPAVQPGFNGRQDSTGRVSVSVGATLVPQSASTEVVVLFLKYNR